MEAATVGAVGAVDRGDGAGGAVMTSVAMTADWASEEITSAAFDSGEGADAATLTGTAIDGRVAPTAIVA